MINSEILTLRNRALDYFTNYYDKYVLVDLEKLSLIRPDANGEGGCTIAQALIVFSLLDLFGYLIRSDTRDKEGENLTPKNLLTDSSRTIELFLEDNKYFSNITRQEIAILTKIYRHGIVHQYFSKKLGIGKPTYDFIPRNDLFYSFKANEINLNVDVLTRRVKHAIEVIRQKVDQNDVDLIRRINERLDYIAETDEQSVNVLVLPNVPITLIPTYTSSSSSSITSQTTRPPETTIASLGDLYQGKYQLNFSYL
jgi:hypothetical protein